MEPFIIGILLAASVIGLTFIVERGFALRQGKIIPASVRGALETYRTTEDLPMLRRICEQQTFAIKPLACPCREASAMAASGKRERFGNQRPA